MASESGERLRVLAGHGFRSFERLIAQWQRRNDDAFNITSVSNQNLVPYAAFSGYNALGQPGRIVFGNGNDSTTSYSYYPLNNRLQEMTTTTPGGGTVQGMVYGYDNVGNVTSITDNVNVDPDNSQQFTYDDLNSLVTATSDSYSAINVSYEAIGNVTANSRVGSYSYNGAGPHAVTMAGTNTYGYDANGNMTSRNTPGTNQVLTYDYDNRVSSITVGSVTTSYVYDFQGNRVEKSTNVPQSTTVYIGNIYEVTDGVATENIFAGNRRIASKTGSSIYYYHPDHLGGLNIATNGSGTVNESVFYYPYGETRVDTGSADLHYKFTGKEKDPESGLYYYGARYYDPALARFISPDSVVQSPGDPQTLNRYSYCRDNPLTYVDPTGQFFGIDDFIIAMLIGFTIGSTTAAITGGDIALGGLTGALTAGAFYGAGSLISELGLQSAVQAGDASAIMEASAIHFMAGAATGAISGEITGGNVGLNALESGVSAGVAYGVGAELGLEPAAKTGWLSNLQPEQKVIADLGFQTTVGSLSGGVTAELGGGNFLQGMGQGARTAAYGFLFNEVYHFLSVSIIGVTFSWNLKTWDSSVSLSNTLLGFSRDYYIGDQPDNTTWEGGLGLGENLGIAGYLNQDNGGSGIVVHAGFSIPIIPAPLTVSAPDPRPQTPAH